MLKLPSALFVFLFIVSANIGTARGQAAKAKPPTKLIEARCGFHSEINTEKGDREPADKPPAKVFRLVRYEAPLGKLEAYVTPDPGDGKKRPAIVWITGGDCNSINNLWDPSPRENDQTALPYRKAGIVLMFPSLRGGNENPGRREGFFGEVDDVIAAAEYLAKLPYVDPKRIYLGGHSTGGTLVMLVAESTDRFRATFSFGPVDDVAGYGPEYLPFNTGNPKEIELRSPGRWLESVRSPLFVLEGTESPGNRRDLLAMAKSTKNPQIHFLTKKKCNHFSILAPANELIAKKILKDTGPDCKITITEEELNVKK